MSDSAHDPCSDFREHLLALEEATPLDALHAQHMAGCEACTELYASLVEVDAELAQLQPIEAPPALVARTLARIDAEPEVASPGSVFGGIFGLVFGGFGRLLTTLFWPILVLRRRPLLGSGLLVAGAAVSGLLVVSTLFLTRDEQSAVSMASPDPVSVASTKSRDRSLEQAENSEPSNGYFDRDTDGVPDEGDGRYGDQAGDNITAGSNRPSDSAGAAFAGSGDVFEDGTVTLDGELDLSENSRRQEATLVPLAGDGANADFRVQLQTAPSSTVARNVDVDRVSGALATPSPSAQDVPAADEPVEVAAAEQPAPAEQAQLQLRDPLAGHRGDLGQRGTVGGSVDGPSPDSARRAHLQPLAQGILSPTPPAVSSSTSTGVELPNGSPSNLDLARAESFLRERERATGLTFQPAAGHFSNSYVPGDPALRSLHQRLVEAGAATLGGTGATGLELAEAARSFAQPFDAPRHSALALYVHADQSATEGERRMLVQVGLRGAARRGGTRPAMNVGVVLDLSRPLGAEDQARVRALLEALSAARDVGDRISLRVAGAQGGERIASGSFRRGQVEVALDQLFRGAAVSTPMAPLSLDAAVRASLASLAADQAPTTPLGSSFLLVVTPGLDVSPSLDRAAHVGAVAGIPTSVVGLGDATLSSLDRLALAGQGRRRLLTDASEAPAMVRSEFDAISQVVARALRLRIRLAPGTRLVSVLGCHRLDAGASARVREAERSIDQRLARSLGIQADREEDADGITIFMPAFYANDSHVILLDVVASAPGPVAEVSVSYKDLLRLRNGEAHSSLALARGTHERGPLERSVLKNLLAYELSQALDQAASRLRSGQAEDARARLAQFVELSRGVRHLMPSFASDHELSADLALVLRYDLALRTLTPPQRVTVADSLRLASRRKLFEPMFSR